MADLVLGLAKTTVEGTVTMARSAMEEEDKLQKRVQRDLLVISDEFEMMHSFLNDAKDRVTDNVTRTLVRQVRNTALDVEDCIETIVHLDNKPHWWRRMILPWCMPAASPAKDLDAAVANIEQLKARVEAMGHRNLRYNRIGDSGHKPVEQTHQQAVANAMVPDIFLAAADAAKKHNGQVDLVTLINKKGIAKLKIGQTNKEKQMEGVVVNNSPKDAARKVIEDTGDENKVIEETEDEKKTAGRPWILRHQLYGRQTDIRWLSWLTQKGGVVSVWGMSGVGKSYLIQHFYYINKKQRSSYMFGWVNVSHPFDVRDFFRRLLWDLNSSSPQDHMIKEPIQACRDYLQTQKKPYFIVVDGLQSTEEWNLIKLAFDFETRSNKINIVIIITNEESVADYCAEDKKSVWNVKGLEVSQAIELFDEVTNKWVFWRTASAETRDQNEKIRDILVQKCGGLPKVICAVAHSWGLVYNIKVKDNLVSMLEANAPRTTRSLEDMFTWLLSYFRSCPDSLKPCIFYLSIFPLNHTIRRRRLVRRWIAEGYFRDKKESTAEENGERSFSKLVNLSMIQAPRTKVDYMRMSLCQVNGFLREYIISRLMEENLVFALEGHCRKNLQRTGRHLAIDNSWDRDRNVFESIDLSLLRSLTVFGKWESFIISGKMKLLRVLDLEDVSSGVTNGDVEKMVKLLPRLKFLSLRRCKQVTRLPDSLGDLKQLQTLDIRETSVIKLPKSIIKLEKLQYIRAGTCATPGCCLSKLSMHRRLDDGSHSGVKVPRGIGKLSSLHTLGVVDISAAGEDDGILEELKNLTQLHKLGVYGINRKNSEKFFSDISRLAHLESLSLQVQLNQDNEAADFMADISSPLVKLRSLKLYGLVDRLPAWVMQMWLQLPGLEKLNLQMKTLPQQELDFILSLRNLRLLRLRLAEFQNGELRFGWGFDQRSSPRYIPFLEIACNSRLQAVKFGSLVHIEILKIRCSSVSPSLQFSGLRTMPSLRIVWLTGSYEDVFKEDLDLELRNNKNKPILKEEEPSSST
ncbi:putative disease resistance protein RXW24L isoform X2 [Panicum miliaceum]|uniref:Disease resistance protein RXW24L isoform X2 n=1 Tax=Panicum miliaceum TaxID=4540 RepID=A0A3L6PHX0_PANMI|nr:putative disease resistance protein RXW24L isoform X2 [Panicum miliaceum]